jgi:hypothetical protein
MKTLERTRAMVCVSNLALAIALVTLLWGQVQAQEQPTDKGAGAAKLLQLTPAKAPPPARAIAARPMTCPKCKSEWISRTDYTARGAMKPKVWVEKHLCDGCDTTISVAGHGKAKRDVVTHKCSSCGAPDMGCCATSNGARPTKGMGKD